MAVNFKLTRHPPSAIASGVTRRLVFAQWPSWFAMAAKIEMLFAVPAQNAAVTYVDSDGDLITISTDDELREFQESSYEHGSVVKFNVVDLDEMRSGTPRTPPPATVSIPAHSLLSTFPFNADGPATLSTVSERLQDLHITQADEFASHGQRLADDDVCTLASTCTSNDASTPSLQHSDPPLVTPQVTAPSQFPNIAQDVTQIISSFASIFATHPELSEGWKNLVQHVSAEYHNIRQALDSSSTEIGSAARDVGHAAGEALLDINGTIRQEASNRLSEAVQSVVTTVANVLNNTHNAAQEADAGVTSTTEETERGVSDTTHSTPTPQLAPSAGASNPSRTGGSHHFEHHFFGGPRHHHHWEGSPSRHHHHHHEGFHHGPPNNFPHGLSGFHHPPPPPPPPPMPHMPPMPHLPPVHSLLDNFGVGPFGIHTPRSATASPWRGPGLGQVNQVHSNLPTHNPDNGSHAATTEGFIPTNPPFQPINVPDLNPSSDSENDQEGEFWRPRNRRHHKWERTKSLGMHTSMRGRGGPRGRAGGRRHRHGYDHALTSSLNLGGDKTWDEWFDDFRVNEKASGNDERSDFEVHEGVGTSSGPRRFGSIRLQTSSMAGYGRNPGPSAPEQSANANNSRNSMSRRVMQRLIDMGFDEKSVSDGLLNLVNQHIDRAARSGKWIEEDELVHDIIDDITDGISVRGNTPDLI